jgi:hypothetical protein
MIALTLPWRKWTRALVWTPWLCALSGYSLSAALSPVALTSGSVNFGTQTVGSSAGTTLTFSFTQSVSIVTPFVVTQGISGQDFQLTGGTCVTGTWNSGQTCTVQVTFQPLYPGLRMGAVVFAGTGQVLATTYLQGVGSGLMPSLSTGLSTLSPPLVPITVAVDPASTVYLGAQANVAGDQKRGAFQTDGTDLGDGFSGVDAMAIDGSGRIYVADHESNCVWITTPAFPYISRVTTCWNPPAGVSVAGPVTVDGSGNLYLADLNSGSVLRFAPDGTRTTAAVCGSGACVLAGFGLSVDASGNLYLSTAQGGACFYQKTLYPGFSGPHCNGAVWKVPPDAAANQSQWTKIWQAGGGSYWVTNYAVSFALDGAGTAYIVDNAKTLWKVSQGSPQSIIDTSSLGLTNWSPWYVAVDGPGNAYVTDSSRLKVYKLSGINFISSIVTTNGVCGSANGQTLNSAPAGNLCSVGTPTAVTGDGPWNWNCLGSNGGAPASCSAQIPPTPINGVCGAANGASFTTPPTANLCSTGFASPLPVSGSGPWTWICGGFNGGTASPVCAATLATGPINGVCSGANGLAFNSQPGNLCAVGNASAITGASGSPWNWSCAGYQNGSKANCSTASASATCTGGAPATVMSGITPMGVSIDNADNVYVGYSKSNSTGYISDNGFDVAGPVSPAYLLGSPAAYGNGNVYYTVDTVPWQNGNRTDCSGGYQSVAADSSGHLYSYTGGKIVKPWCTAGTTSDVVVAGGGSGCPAQTDSFGDGCPATSAKLSNVTSLAFDTANNLYFADFNGVNIRKLDAASNLVIPVAFHPCDTTVAGSMAVDYHGFLYFGNGNHVYRVDTVAGVLNPGNLAVCQQVSIPGLVQVVGVALDSRGNLYVADAGAGAVVQVSGIAGDNCGGLTPLNAGCGGAADSGVSNPTQDLCSYGSPSPVAGLSSGPWTWTCIGQSYGSNIFCGTYPATLTVSATGTMVQGSAPVFAPVYSGWVNGDTDYLVNGLPQFSTTATATSPPGKYPITVSRGTLSAYGLYNFVFVPGTLSVVAAPTVKLSVSPTITRQGSAYQAAVVIANSGDADALNVVLTTATVGSTNGAPLPQSVGTVKAGSSATVTVTFPLSAGTGGQATVAKFGGTYTGGTFSGSTRVTLP